MPSHNITTQWTNGARTYSGVATVTAENEINVDVTVPASSTNWEIDVAWIVAQQQSAFLLAGSDMTLKVNSTSSPTATITLKAGIPLAWYSGGNGTNPYGATNVSKVYVTSTAGGSLYLCNLVDPTP